MKRGRSVRISLAFDARIILLSRRVVFDNDRGRIVQQQPDLGGEYEIVKKQIAQTVSEAFVSRSRMYRVRRKIISVDIKYLRQNHLLSRNVNSDVFPDIKYSLRVQLFIKVQRIQNGYIARKGQIGRTQYKVRIRSCNSQRIVSERV